MLVEWKLLEGRTPVIKLWLLALDEKPYEEMDPINHVVAFTTS